MNYTEQGELKDQGRMDTPAFHRNHEFIVDLLKQELAECTGDVLEVGSGSGQHALAFAKALPDLNFWPTDFNPEHLVSINAWRREDNSKNLKPAAQLDVAALDWRLGREECPPDKFAAMISLNMVHISPISVAEGLFRGAGLHLSAAGKLFIYGPFKEDGVHTASSNAEFDAFLKARNPDWGVRDIIDLENFARQYGLVLDRRTAMPANNFTLIFCRGK
jgi:SAM-dependent methyltransferase